MPRPDEKYLLDRDGYRKNVGIIVCNDLTQVLWARRIRHDGWQFPQGGIEPRESARDAAFRELYEEIGLVGKDVKLLGSTDKWMRYDVPYAPKANYYRRTRSFRGQKQRWFLFKLVAQESSVRLDLTENPEFDHWQWVDYWRPLQQIVAFKRSVYKQALTELEPLLSQTSGYKYQNPISIT
jgi:putative (di)nucleoside polyphosphate hydrolase